MQELDEAQLLQREKETLEPIFKQRIKELEEEKKDLADT